MTTTNILGGGLAQTQNDQSVFNSVLPHYMAAANRAQLVCLGDVIDPTTLTLELLADSQAMLRAALAIDPQHKDSATHLRAVIKAVLVRLEQSGNAIDWEFEQLFSMGAEVVQ